MSDHALFLAGLNGQLNGRGTGAHRIATILRKEGWDVEVLDFMIAWTNEQLEEYFKSRLKPSTKIIGYSYTFHTWDDRFYRLFMWIRKLRPDIKIVVGGVGVELCPLEADYYINNYAEFAIFEVIKHIQGTSTERLKYTFHKSGKLIRANYDYPAFPLKDLRVSFEDRDFIDSRETLVVETCRGCKFKCAFCTYPILGIKNDHTISEESYVQHLQEGYDRWGVTHWTAADETFNDSTEKLEKFANATSKLSFKPNLTGFIRPDLMVSRRQDWPLLEAMGFWGHWYGVESFNHLSAKSIGKGMHPDKIKEGLLEVKKYFKSRGKYKGSISVIIGLPYETEETVRQGWDWLKQNWKGQFVACYALYIPKREFTEETNTLSNTWQSMGYQEIEKITEFTPENTYSGGSGVYYREGLKTGVRWKSKSLDFEKAHMMVDEFYGFSGNFFSVSNYTMADYRLAFCNDLELWLDTPTFNHNVGTLADAARSKFYADYITKKLNWKP